LPSFRAIATGNAPPLYVTFALSCSPPSARPSAGRSHCIRRDERLRFKCPSSIEKPRPRSGFSFVNLQLYPLEGSVRTFIYKRTHKRDPDSQGRFGIQDCMGSLRTCDFDAVIGIGGICAWARAEGISRKLNWIGIGPRKQPLSGKRGPLVTFDHFLLFEEDGVDFHTIAPTLARRLYFAKAARFVFSDSFNRTEKAEVNRILRLAKSAPPSEKRYTVYERNSANCSSKHCGSNSARLPSRPSTTACLAPS
jgi:hypothetical protein